MPALKRFSPSGALPSAGLSKFIGFGLLAAIISGAIYGAFNVYNPLSYIPIGIMGIHVGSIGLLIMWGVTVFAVSIALEKFVRSSKLQNPLVTGLIGIGLGVVAWYTHWCVLAMLAVKEIVILPNDIYSFMSAMVENEYMTVGLFEAPSTNWFFWGIEALGYLGAGFVGARAAASVPFCGTCEEWADAPAGGIDLPLMMQEDQAKDAIEKGDFDGVVASISTDAAQFFRIQMKGCSACKERTFLALSKLTFTQDDDGDIKESVDVLTEDLEIAANEEPSLNGILSRALQLEGGVEIFGFSDDAVSGPQPSS